MALLSESRPGGGSRPSFAPRSRVGRALGRAVAALLLALLGEGTAFAAVATGDVAPEIELPDLEGRTVRLPASRGRIVLLDFWASWCVPCAAEMACLHELRARHPAEVQLLSVTIDRDADVARRFVAEKLPQGELTVLHDAGGDVLATWGAEGLPALYLIDRTGIVRGVQHGAGGCKALEPALHEVLGSTPPVEPSAAMP